LRIAVKKYVNWPVKFDLKENIGHFLVVMGVFENKLTIIKNQICIVIFILMLEIFYCFKF
jgi:hypothetical protein